MDENSGASRIAINYLQGTTCNFLDKREVKLTRMRYPEVVRGGSGLGHQPRLPRNRIPEEETGAKDIVETLFDFLRRCNLERDVGRNRISRGLFTIMD
jgi:hypothetical protein